MSTPASRSGAQARSAAATVSSSTSPPACISDARSGEPTETSCAVPPEASSRARSYAPLSTVAQVAIRPTLPVRVTAAARRDSGRDTLTTATRPARCSRSSGSAAAVAELQATTSSLAP